MRRAGWLIGVGVASLGLVIWLLWPGGQTVLSGFFNQTPAWFTQVQAEQGQRVALQKCALCHGKKLEGKVGPQLIGPRFMGKWSGKTAGELSQFIQARMPLTRPGSLKPAETLVLVAYILQGNGYPAGEQELTPQALPEIRLEQSAP